jgi:hypothetical protein
VTITVRVSTGAAAALATIVRLAINCVSELKNNYSRQLPAEAARGARGKVAGDGYSHAFPSTPESGVSNDTIGAVGEGAATLNALVRLPL